ncbi:MAG: hypothetical protein Q9214_006661, partial [Letrouitia sp. 1 TL-2023]
MLRLRRYRAFLVFAAFLTITLYYFTSVGEFGSRSAASVNDLASVSTQESTTSSSTDNVKVTPEEPLNDVPKSKLSEDERTRDDTDQDDDTPSDSKSSDEKPSPS